MAEKHYYRPESKKLSIHLPSGKFCLFYHKNPQRNVITDERDIAYLGKIDNIHEVVQLPDGRWVRKPDGGVNPARGVVIESQEPESVPSGAEHPLAKQLEDEPPLPETEDDESDSDDDDGYSKEDLEAFTKDELLELADEDFSDLELKSSMKKADMVDAILKAQDK